MTTSSPFRQMSRNVKLAVLASALFGVGVRPANAQYAMGVAALRIEAPNGKRSLILGSLHVASVLLREPAVSALQGAKVFVTEHDSGMPDPADSAAHGRLAEWAKNLTDEELTTYFARATCAGISKERAAKMLTYRSVQSANQVAYTVCGDAQLSPSRDIYMARLAQHLDHQTLEDWRWVESQRHKLLVEDAAVALRWILHREPRAVIDAVALALNEGDYERIATLTQSSQGGGEPASRAYDIMVKQRNDAWMSRLTQSLDAGDALVLVGAVHLPGPDGLIARLAAKGYIVRKVTLPGVLPRN